LFQQKLRNELQQRHAAEKDRQIEGLKKEEEEEVSDQRKENAEERVEIAILQKQMQELLKKLVSNF